MTEITLQEESYCQLRATGETKRSAYRKAYGASGIDVKDATVDTAVNRLEKRPEILARIAEVKTDYNEENKVKWAKRKEEVCESMYEGIRDAARGVLSKGKDGVMSIHDATKTIQVLAELKGWKEPEKIDIGPTAAAADQAEVNRKLDALLEKAGVDKANEETEEE